MSACTDILTGSICYFQSLSSLNTDYLELNGQDLIPFGSDINLLFFCRSIMIKHWHVHVLNLKNIGYFLFLNFISYCSQFLLEVFSVKGSEAFTTKALCGAESWCHSQELGGAAVMPDCFGLPTSSPSLPGWRACAVVCWMNPYSSSEVQVIYHSIYPASGVGLVFKFFYWIYWGDID